MDIVQHISELLFEHDCVIVHGFGGFVASYQSAKIHPVQHTFSPPVKNILFNKDLRNNDGLLANRIVSYEHISYDLALEEINAFTTKCLQKLNNGESVDLDGIGQLYPDNEGNIQFEQRSKINFLKETYGMSSFVSPAIQRHSHRKTQEIRPNFADRQKSKNQKIGATVLLRIAASIAVLAILSIAGYNYFNPPTPGLNETSIISAPDQYVNQNLTDAIITDDSQIDNSEIIEKEIIPKQSDEIEIVDNIKDDLTSFNNNETVTNTGLNTEEAESNDLNEASPIPVSPPDTEETVTNNTIISAEVAPETIISDDVQKPLQRMYHLIAGSFQDTENASTMIDVFRQRGYEPQMIGPAENGYYRVSISACVRKSDALVELRKARDLYNPNIWLLRN